MTSPTARPPSVDALARSIADVSTDSRGSEPLPHPLLVDAARRAIAAGRPDDARREAEAIAAALLQPVVNATGVLLHTNLGRAPTLDVGALAASNLELDLQTGRRGDRFAGVGSLTARCCGADAAIVVNNGAAAVLLVLAALAGDGRQVIVSRGESVEIGGGFRIPEVAAQSGGVLVDVGTTNRTRLSDYADAVDRAPDSVACVLRVHPSNFRVEGFTSTVPVRALRDLAVPVVVDLGSGLLDARCPWLAGGPPPWLAGEMAARQVLDDGAALVTFSGDKLLGGPQAGIIAGRADLVERCARHPLARALRPGSTILRALQDVLLAYLRGDGDAIPFWRMATTPLSTLERRAEQVRDRLQNRADLAVQVAPSTALAGAGSAPGAGIESVAVTVPGDHAAALREAPERVIVRVEDDVTVCDLRSIDPAQDDDLVTALARLDR